MSQGSALLHCLLANTGKEIRHMRQGLFWTERYSQPSSSPTLQLVTASVYLQYDRRAWKAFPSSDALRFSLRLYDSFLFLFVLNHLFLISECFIYSNYSHSELNISALGRFHTRTFLKTIWYYWYWIYRFFFFSTFFLLTVKMSLITKLSKNYSPFVPAVVNVYDSIIYKFKMLSHFTPTKVWDHHYSFHSTCWHSHIPTWLWPLTCLSDNMCVNVLSQQHQCVPAHWVCAHLRHTVSY